MFLKPSISTRTFALSLLNWGKVFNCGLTVSRRAINGHCKYLIQHVEFEGLQPNFTSVTWISENRLTTISPKINGFLMIYGRTEVNLFA